MLAIILLISTPNMVATRLPIQHLQKDICYISPNAHFPCTYYDLYIHDLANLHTNIFNFECLHSILDVMYKLLS